MKIKVLTACALSSIRDTLIVITVFSAWEESQTLFFVLNDLSPRRGIKDADTTEGQKPNN